MIKKILKKLKSTNAETLVETLVAVMIIALTFVGLVTCIVTSAKINKETRDMDNEFRAVNESTDTITVSVTGMDTNNVGEAANMAIPDIPVYRTVGAEDTNSFTYYGEDEEGKTDILYHNVTYYYNESVSEVYETDKVQHGLQASNINHPSPERAGRPNSEFLYWAMKGDTEQYDFHTPVENDLELYGLWQQLAPQYTVTFDWNRTASTQVDPYAYVTVDEGSLVEAPEAPERTGYTFDGWARAKDGSNLWNFDTDTVTEDVTLYAKWTPITYYVDFEPNDPLIEKIMNPQTLTYDQPEALTPVGYKKDGYVFAGWALSSDSAPVYGDQAIVKNLTNKAGATVKLYAIWMSNDIAVSFETFGGQPVPETQYTNFGGKINKPAVDPSLDGYVFDAWCTSEDCKEGTEWNFDTNTCEENMVLYARYRGTEYTIEYYGNGSTSGATASSKHEVGVAAPLTKNGFSREYTVRFDGNGGTTPEPITFRYTFNGWNTQPNGSGSAFADGESVLDLNRQGNIVKLYAQWDAEPIQLPESTLDGMVFQGWFTEKEGGYKINSDRFMADQNDTYYAQWMEPSVTINYTIAEGQEQMGKISRQQEIVNILKGKVEGSTATANPGYQFINWTDLEGNPITFDPTIVPELADGTYVAHFAEASMVTIYYKVAEGSEGMGTVTPGAEDVRPLDQALGSVASPYEGSQFVKWIDENGKTVSEKAEFIPAKVGSVNVAATYYAVFADKKVTLNYVSENPNIGTVNPSYETLNAHAESAKGATATVRNTSYIFESWTDENGNVVSTDATFVPSKTGDFYIDQTYTAHFAKKVTIRWDANGGYVSSSAVTTVTPPDPWSCIAGSALRNFAPESTRGELPTATCKVSSYWGTTEYTFIGWFTSSGEQISNMTPAPNNDTTYYAHWLSPYSYSKDIIFKDGDQEIFRQSIQLQWQYDREAQRYYFTGTITKPADPVKEGYVFDGWYTDPTGGTEWTTFGTPFETNYDTMYLYAHWTAATWTINYDPNGGTGSASDKVTKGNSIAVRSGSGFSKENASFSGWNTMADGSGTAYQPGNSITPDADVTLYAQWTDNIVIYYEVGDGEGSVDPASENLEPTATRATGSTATADDGYHFASWTNEAGEVVESDIPHYTPKPNAETGMFDAATYYANFDATSYSIKYDLDGGTAENPATYTILDTVTLNAPEKLGYEFTGWTGTDLKEQTMDVTFSGVFGDREYTAHYQPITYTIDYVDEIGQPIDAGSNPKTYTIESAALTISAPAEKLGYRFTVWTGPDLPESGAPSFVITTGSTGNRVYTAHWEQIPYYVSFYVNDKPYDKVQEVYYPNKAAKPADPEVSGYEFEGWFEKDAETAFNFDDPITKDTSLYAKLTKLVSVTYDPNGAEGTIYTSNVKEGTPIDENTFIKSTYEFVCWNTEPDGSGDRYAAGDPVPAHDLHLYPQWTKKHITITYDANGGTEDDVKQNALSGETVILKNGDIFSRDHYEFKEWNTQKDGKGDSYAAGSEQAFEDSLTLYAIYTPIEYSITYDLQDGALEEGDSNPESYNIESADITLKNPKKAGFEFMGWSGTEIAGVSKNITIAHGSTGDRVYTANWESKLCKVTYMVGEQMYSSETVAYGGTATRPAIDPTQKDSNFLGWRQQNVASNFDFNTPIESDLILYAAFDYAIYYNLDGGSWETGKENPDHYDGSTDITLNNPVKDGYTFKGWTGTDLTSPTLDVTIPKGATGSRSYLANWEENVQTVKVIWDKNSNRSISVNPLQNDGVKVNKRLGDSISKLAEVSPSSNFLGWFTLPEGGTQVSLNSVVEAPESGDTVYYYAHWNSERYSKTIHFRGINPEFDQKIQLIRHGLIGIFTRVYYTGAIIEPDEPFKEGYHFDGWYDGNKKFEDFNNENTEFEDTSDMTLTAHWTPISYSITYDLDGGKWNSYNPPTTYNIESNNINITSKPVKTGYTFTGWSGTGIAGLADSISIPQGSTGDRSYKANWIANEYTVTFDNAGVTFATQKVPYDGKAVKPASDPVKNGYTFSGWYKQLYDQNSYDFNTPVRANLTLHAKFAAAEYAITYEGLEGATVSGNPNKYTIESNPITLNNPTKEGYVFAGWSGTGIAGMSQNVMIPTGSFGDRTYTANWVADKYTVTFMSEGEVFDTKQVEYGKTVTKPETDPTKTNYDFIGWFNGDQEFSFNTPVTGNMTLDAKFAAHKFSISYKLNGGTVSGNPEEYTVLSDDITLNNPTKDGYTFLGWTGTGLEEMTEIVTIKSGSTGNRVYTANWKINEYIVTFMDGEEVFDEQTVQYNEKVTAPDPAPEKEYYTFDGWYDGDAAFDFNTAITEDLTLDAKYTPVEFTIGYELDGGALEEGKTNPESYNIESDDITLNNPSKTGYTFKGWILDGTTEPVETVIIKKGSHGDRYYTATWELAEYTIEYQLDGGELPEGVTNPESYNINTEDITLNNPIKTGYDFAGWTGSDLEEPTMNVVIPQGSTGDRTYTATWTVHDYAITYDLGEDVEDPGNPSTYTIETETFTLNNPVRTHYDFAGWLKDGDQEASMTVTIRKGTYGDLHYTAQWTEKPIITVKWDSQGGTDVEDSYVYRDDAIGTMPEDPTKTHYNFDGWYTAVSGGSPVTAATVPELTVDHTVTYYAHWKIKDDYVITWDTQGGTAVDPSNVTPGTAIGTLPETTLTHYDFQGWFTEVTGGTQIDESYVPESDMTLYAQWVEKPQFTITWDSMGGTPESYSTSVYRDDPVGELPEAPVKTHYDFQGWFTAETGGEQVTEDTKPMDNVTYYAQWAIKDDYKITWDTQEGTAVDPSYVKPGTAIGTLPETTRDHYEFQGWFTEATGGTQIDESYVPESDMTLYAQWTAIGYMVTYDGNGAEDGSTDPQLVPFESSVKARACGFTRNYYNFIEWNTEADGSGQSYKPNDTISNLTSDLTLYAQWEGMLITVNFDKNGGSGTMAPMTFHYGETFVVPNCAYRGPTQGFLFWIERAYFKYWTYDDNRVDAGARINPGDDLYPTAETVTLKANWDYEVSTVDITYQYGSNKYTDTIASGYPYSVRDADTFTQKGSILKSWKDNDGNTYTPGSQQTFTSDKTLQPVWESKTIHVTYKPGQGTGSMDESSFAYGSNYTVPNCTMTAPEGKTFSYWKDSDGNIYLAGQVLKSTDAHYPEEDMELTAQWRKKIHISYDPNGATGQSITDEAWAEDSYTLRGTDTFSQKGYDLTKWTDNVNEYDPGSVQTFAEDKELYAKWEARTIHVSYKRGEATGGSMDPTTFTYGSIYTVPDCTMQAPYRKMFQNWKDASGKVYAAGTSLNVNDALYPDHDLELTAQWVSLPQYTVTWNTDGGTSVTPTKVYQGEKIGTLPVTTKDHHTFDGWFDENNRQINADEVITANVTFYAHWTEDPKWTITWDANGGSPDATTYVYDGDKLVLPADPTRVSGMGSYTFLGWYTSETGGYQVTSDIVPDGNKHYYAHWTNSYFGTRTATFYDQNGQPLFTQKFERNGKIIEPLAPYREGYVFKGWYTSRTGDEKFNFNSTYSSNQYIYGHWSDRYTISYDRNGGSGTVPSSEDCKIGDFYTVKAGSSLSRTGYTFIGWSDGKGNTYQAGDTFIPTGDTTLSAQWKKKVTFGVCKRSGSGKNRTYSWQYNEDGVEKSGTTGPLDNPDYNGSYYFYSGVTASDIKIEGYTNKKWTEIKAGNADTLNSLYNYSSIRFTYNGKTYTYQP